MANAATLAAIGIKITAINDASATLSKIAAEMKSLGKIAADDKTDLFTRLGLTPKNLTMVRKEFGEVRKSVGATISTVGRFFPAIGALTGVGVVAGIAGIVQSFTTLAAQTGRTADQLGIPITQFYNLQKAGQLAGVSMETVTSGVAGLQDTLADAAFGRNNVAAQTFRALGIDFGSVAHGAADVMKVMPQVFDVVQRLVKVGDTHAALRLLDLTGLGRDMFTFAKDGAEGLARWNAEAAKSPQLTEAQREAARKLEIAQGELLQQFKGMGLQLATALSPALQHATDQMTKWVEGHPAETKAFFDNLGSGVLHLSENIDKLVSSAETAGSLWLIQKLFGWGPAALAAAGAVAGSMGAPMVDDYGRQVGNWGGDEGQQIWEQRNKEWGAPSRRGRDPATDPQSLSYVPDSQRPGFVNRVWRSMFVAPGGGQEAGASPADAIRWYRAHGYDLAHASAMAANIQYESGFDPYKRGNNGEDVFGLFQWDRKRRSDFERLFGHPIENSKPWEQYAFADWELYNTERTAGADFFDTPGAAAGGVLSNEYERPHDKPTNERLRTGQTAEYMQQYGGAMPMPSGPAIQPPAASAWGGELGSALARLRVDINHNNAPPGSSVAVSSDHPAVTVAPVNIMHAMPASG